MQLVANQALVRNRSRVGLVFNLAALAVVFGGLIELWQVDIAAGQIPYVAYGAVAVGTVLFYISQTQLKRWGPNVRQEAPLNGALRGLDDRYKLYAFLSSSLPDYILISPAGVHVIVPRQESGVISCARDKWRKASSGLRGMFGQGIGNPSADAQHQLQQVQRLLSQEGIEDVPSGAIVVFTDPKVQLRIDGCTATVTRLGELKDVLRRKAGKGQSVVLSQGRVREIQRVFDDRMRAARAWR